MASIDFPISSLLSCTILQRSRFMETFDLSLLPLMGVQPAGFSISMTITACFPLKHVGLSRHRLTRILVACQKKGYHIHCRTIEVLHQTSTEEKPGAPSRNHTPCIPGHPEAVIEISSSLSLRRQMWLQRSRLPIISSRGSLPQLFKTLAVRNRGLSGLGLLKSMSPLICHCSP